MRGKPLSEADAKEAAEVYRQYGVTHGARRLGLDHRTFRGRVDTAVLRGLVKISDFVGGDPRRPVVLDDKEETIGNDRLSGIDPAALRSMLMRTPVTLDDLVKKLGVSRGQALDAVEALRDEGANLQQFGDRWSIEKAPAPQHVKGDIPTYTSRPDGTFVFGFTSDNHIGSKYARLDVLDALYDNFARIGVDRVFNAGNWIDGEARFNKHDLLIHGMDNQLRELARRYPKRRGIVTYAVAGDDHEGWYAQTQGVDIGRHAQNVMRSAGREDWVDLGYMEAYVRLVHAGTGQSNMLHVIHPGGGSAYAISYTVQKIAESYDGGDKPACALVGHYHKLGYNLVRNVHMIQTGTTEDQTPFMRKKKLSAHVGGGACRLTMDEKTGAITACAVEFFPFFNRDYVNNRWDMSDDVVHTDRGAG